MLKKTVERGLPLALLLVSLASALSSCSDSVSSNYAGILEVDSAGFIVGGDSTDWTLGDLETGNFTFGPAIPNPCSSDAGVVFSIASETRCNIKLQKQGGAIIQNITDDVLAPGYHLVSIPHPGAPGIYRVTFESSLGTSYGDIEFK